MAEQLDPKAPVTDSIADNLDINYALLDPIDEDDFDDILVPEDDAYVDPDMGDPTAGLEFPIGTIDGSMLPVTTIDMSTVVKTRKVLATGQVVYDVTFDVVDIGADSYEVTYTKQ